MVFDGRASRRGCKRHVVRATHIRQIAAAVNLDGWSLTDTAGNLTKWRFPATNLATGASLVVFASGKDRRVPGATLHT